MLITDAVNLDLEDSVGPADQEWGACCKHGLLPVDGPFGVLVTMTAISRRPNAR